MTVTTVVVSFLGIVLLSASWVVAAKARKRIRRQRLMAEPMPSSWEKILRRRFPRFYQLPEDLQSRLVGIMHVFIEEKRFEACGGLDAITEEIRVTVAVQACFLLIGIRKHDFFPRLVSILIYPGAYRDRRRRTFDLPSEGNEVRLGESWHSGSVVLSWESVLKGAASEDDGINVVFHEFAHQLDQIDYSADGAPPLPYRGDYAEWANIFSREYEAHVEAVNRHKGHPVLDPYGAENPAEFFAVATEAFFEVPGDLRASHPELYDQLEKYYGVDPGLWS
jgi:Mlc titration factor MtfA (ptsG expression regulator)